MKQQVATPYGSTSVYRKGDEAGKHILIVPGFGESIVHNQSLVDTLADSGEYDVFTFDQPRGGSTHDPLRRQRDIILGVLDATLPDGESVHAVAHSLGSASLLRAAIKNPEQFLSLILMEPPGVTSSQSFLQLARRVGFKIVRNHLYAARKHPSLSASLRHVIRTQLSSISVIMQNPRLALKEANAARQHSLEGDVASVYALEIPVYIVRAHSDELFIAKQLPESEDILELAGSYCSTLDRHAGHDTFWLHPEQTAQTVDVFINRHHKG